jgi:16S rRNA (guanine527-N7)-methyltransferase
METLNPNLSQDLQAMLGLRLSSQQRSAFDWYARELQAWNKKFNLTAITEPIQIEVKHFLDSLSCLLIPELRPPAKVMDIGTGAGFPGLPIKIVFPGFDLKLVESIGKKADFCRHVVEGLSLDGVEILHARAEDVGRDPGQRSAYDWVLARAVAPLPTLLEYVLPLLKLEGRAVLQKGDRAPSEVQGSSKALKLLGGEVEALVPVELPRVPETRYLVSLRKCAETPAIYPRRAGMPGKRPLA